MAAVAATLAGGGGSVDASQEGEGREGWSISEPAMIGQIYDRQGRF